MHELGIVFHIIKSVKSVCAENHVSHVSNVTLELGEVSGVVDSYLLDCWGWAVSKEEVMKDCTLTIEAISAITICEDCNKTYATVVNGKTCPHCGSMHTVLQTGNEVMIKEICVE